MLPLLSRTAFSDDLGIRTLQLQILPGFVFALNILG